MLAAPYVCVCVCVFLSCLFNFHPSNENTLIKPASNDFREVLFLTTWNERNAPGSVSSRGGTIKGWSGTGLRPRPLQRSPTLRVVWDLWDLHRTYVQRDTWPQHCDPRKGSQPGQINVNTHIGRTDPSAPSVDYHPAASLWLRYIAS